MPDTDLGRTVAKNLKRILYEKRMTAADLSRALGIGKTTISGWMNNFRVPSADNIDLLCSYLGIRRSDLFEEHTDGEQPYYLNEETARIAQEIFDSPETRMLLDASRNARPEDIRLAAEMLKRFKEANPNG